MQQEELERTWEDVRRELRRSVSDLTFHLWLDPLELAGRRSDLLFVRAPAHIRTLVRERYAHLLRAAAQRTLEAQVAVEVVGDEWCEEESGSPATGRLAARPASTDPLNPKYTFEQFVIGDANRLAHAAALVVAEQPGQAYNPLFLHGPPGLGKTHLLQAIGHYVRRHGTGLTVRYATADEFTGAFVGALRGGDAAAFKAEFRAIDVLLVDDVQFLADRTKTREEFFHIFNALYESGCQLAVSSDRPPHDMAAFEHRLAERFGAGLVAELDTPDLEVRVAILRKLALMEEFPQLDDETLTETARHVGSVRMLQGALIRLMAHASLHGTTPTPELARRVLAREAGGRALGPATIPGIQAATAVEFGVPAASLTAKDRRPHVALARQVAMYLARELTDDSLPAIGAAFGGRNHSTVLHAHRKVARQIENDDASGARITGLATSLAGPDRRE